MTKSRSLFTICATIFMVFVLALVVGVIGHQSSAVKATGKTLTGGISLPGSYGNGENVRIAQGGPPPPDDDDDVGNVKIAQGGPPPPDDDDDVGNVRIAQGGPPPPDGSNPPAGDHAMLAGPSGAGMSPPRFVPTGPLHTIVIVEMPPLADVIKALEEDALPPNHDPSRPPSNGEGSQSREGSNGASPPHPSITGRSLPLLFIRAYDGVGYHSGRTIACENVFQSMDLSAVQNPANGIEPGWLAAAQAAAAAEGGLHGWTLRVM